jgi:RNA polymerase sigma-70 factor (ECF subfamily)
MSSGAQDTVWGFPATSWTLVRRAREGGDERAAGAALDALCRAYWRPLYAYARGRGLARADAQDAVQEFFAVALRRELFGRADAERGRLRSFLLTAFKRVLLDRVEHAAAERRRPEGGWAEGDFEAAEAEWARMGGGATGIAGPDAAFERQWARELVAQARRRLANRYAAEGKAELFRELETEALDGEMSSAGEPRSRDGARRVALHRLRKRFAEELRKVVADTLPEGGDVEAELRELGAALAEGRA